MLANRSRVITVLSLVAALVCVTAFATPEASRTASEEGTREGAATLAQADAPGEGDVPSGEIAPSIFPPPPDPSEVENPRNLVPAAETAAPLPAEAAADAAAEPTSRDVPVETRAKDEAEPSKVDPACEPPMPARSLLDALENVAADRRRINVERKALEEERRSFERLKAELDESKAALLAEMERLNEIIELMDRKRRKDDEEADAEAAKKRLADRAKFIKAMRGMKTDKLATMVSKLDREMAVDLLKQMKPVDAVTVLEKMEPALAAVLAKSLLARPASKKGSDG